LRRIQKHTIFLEQRNIWDIPSIQMRQPDKSGKAF